MFVPLRQLNGGGPSELDMIFEQTHDFAAEETQQNKQQCGDGEPIAKRLRS